MAIDTETTPLMTVKDVSRVLNVHINTVRRWSNKGILKSCRIGDRGDRRFKKEDVSRFLIESWSPNYNEENATQSDDLFIHT